MGNKRLLSKIKTEILDLIFPRKCLGCLTEGVWLCQNCFLKFKMLKPIIRRHNSMTILAAGSYRDPLLQKMINYLKYSGVTELAPQGAKILAGLISTYSDDLFDLIVPIPLHPRRQAERTFNQSALLAAELAKILLIDFSDSLERIRYSESQTHLSDKERKENVKDIFRVKAEKERSVIGRSILLVDDVITSGATINEAAKTLKHSGTLKVTALCLAAR